MIIVYWSRISLIRNFIQLIWARYTANNLAYQSVSISRISLSQICISLSLGSPPFWEGQGVGLFLIDNAKLQNNAGEHKFSRANV